MRPGALLVLTTFALAVDAVAAVAQQADARPVRKRTVYEDLQMFSQVLNQIRVNHPDSVDTHELLMAAVRGMVQAADPHSYVIPAIRLEPGKETALRDGKLHPVPIAFTFVGGAPVVVSLEPRARAAGLDVLPGDELIAIDGKPVAAESAEELEITLAGPRGTPVALTFERRRPDGSLVRLARAVKRERPEQESGVPAAFLLDATTGYVRITTFATSKVADELHTALGALEKGGMQRLILDLRDNGGGRVDQAADVAGEFLPKGAVLYSTAGRKAEVGDTVRVKRSFWRSERRYPVVVLVNEGTASASELVAGALQDHDRALVAGRPSFGKSLLMQGFPMADGSVLVLVVGHAMTPCGRVVQRQYRAITRREYYRLARAERDTVGRPSCKTTNGRTVYGGGGIYPDVAIAEPPSAPAWLARVHEEAVVLAWVGGYLTSTGARLTTPDALAAAPTLPAQALTDFRAFASRQGIAIPSEPDADAWLQRALVLRVAAAKWGDPGYYRVSAAVDPEITAATRSFDRALAILLGR
ncbi:MAG: S41 family peptidase [Gemmatimonadaceae bacterium]